MPPLPADSIHARACKLKCEKILTRPLQCRVAIGNLGCHLITKDNRITVYPFTHSVTDKPL